MSGTLPPVTYLATDSIQEGIGASQILAYVERLAAKGVDLRLHTFEKAAPSDALRDRLRAAGVDWHSHDFGAFGTAGGIRRLIAGARAVRGAELVHARSDLAAASVMLARCPRWLWDVRSLWVDQRIDLGTVVPGSRMERALRALEAAAAQRSTRIVTLTEAVLPVLDERYGPGTSTKATVIPTCVDTARFPVSPPPDGPLRFLLSGTINAYYDVPLMVDLVVEAKRRRPAELALLTPEQTSWEELLEPVVDERGSATHDKVPAHVARCHVGLSVCRSDVGISRVASMPTKIAEFLACGRPVLVNDGLGDASRLLREHRAGVVVADGSPEAVRHAVDEVETLLADPGTAARCRGLAEAHFDLDGAADRLVATYHGLAAVPAR